MVFCTVWKKCPFFYPCAISGSYQFRGQFNSMPSLTLRVQPFVKGRLSAFPNCIVHSRPKNMFHTQRIPLYNLIKYYSYSWTCSHTVLKLYLTSRTPNIPQSTVTCALNICLSHAVVIITIITTSIIIIISTLLWPLTLPAGADC